MRYPMILPWLAKKAGVPAATAERLWDEVTRAKDTRPGTRGSNWASALREFRGRLSRERKYEARAFEASPLSVFLIQTLIFQQVWAAWAGMLRGMCAAWPRPPLRPRAT